MGDSQIQSLIFSLKTKLVHDVTGWANMTLFLASVTRHLIGPLYLNIEGFDWCEFKNHPFLHKFLFSSKLNIQKLCSIVSCILKKPD